MPKRRSPLSSPAASSPAGDAPRSPAGTPLAPVFNRRLLPKEVKKAATDAGITDQDILLFWAAYERGRQDEREGRLAAIEERLAGLESQSRPPDRGWIDRKHSPGEDDYLGDFDQSPRPDNSLLPPRPDLDAMEWAKAARASGQEPLRLVKKEPTSQNGAGQELPIGRYPAELVTDLVAFAQANSTNPSRAREIMRDYLVECEPTCKNPPSSTGKTVLLRMQTEKILKGEQTTRLGTLDDMDEGEVDKAVQTFGGDG